MVLSTSCTVHRRETHGIRHQRPLGARLEMQLRGYQVCGAMRALEFFTRRLFDGGQSDACVQFLYVNLASPLLGNEPFHASLSEEDLNDLLCGQWPAGALEAKTLPKLPLGGHADLAFCARPQELAAFSPAHRYGPRHVSATRIHTSKHFNLDACLDRCCGYVAPHRNLCSTPTLSASSRLQSRRQERLPTRGATHQ